jgi:flagellar hook assembly protein FlgD
LVIAGTTSSRVVFDKLGTGNWGTIVFHQDSNDAVCRIVDADLLNGGGTQTTSTVVNCDYAAPMLSGVLIKNAPGAAIRLSGSTANYVANIVVDDVRVEDCGHGVQSYVDGAGSVEIRDSTFDNVNGDAVYSEGNGLNLVDGCSFVDVGRGLFSNGAGAIVVHDCSVENWSTVGIESAAGSYPSVLGTSFHGTGYPLKVPASTMDMIGHAVPANSYTLGSGSLIGLFTDTLEHAAHWSNFAGVPVRVLGDVTFNAPLTIDAGLRIEVISNTKLDANTTLLPPLRVCGTATSPVVFTSGQSTPAAGDWKTMNVGPGSVIEYATFEYGGRTSSPALKLNGPCTVRNTIVRYSQGHGLDQVGTTTMTVPSSIEDCTLTSNGGNGFYAEPYAKAQLTRVTSTSNSAYGVRSATGNSSYPSSIGLRECSITSNTSGGLDAGSYTTFDAALCWWGHATGPGGSGPGSGQAISGAGTVSFNPWYGTTLGTFRWTDADVSPLALPPTAGAITFHAEANAAASWDLEVVNSSSTTVFSNTGSDTADASWDGTDGGSPPVPYSNGTYTFTLTASQTGSSATSQIRGTLALDSTLLTAKLTSPTALAYVVAGTSINIQGSAGGTQFTSYVLEYGLGAAPPSYNQISTSTTAVSNNVLGAFTPPVSAQGLITLRVRALGTGGLTAKDSRMVKLYCVADSATAPEPFSPNADGFEDTTSYAATLTWPSNWTLKVFDGTTGPLRTWSGAGTQVAMPWDGKDQSGTTLTDANYTLRLEASPTDASSVTVVDDTTAGINNSGRAVQILSPVDGAVLTGDVPVTLQVDTDPGVDYFVRLEYSPDPNWVLLDNGTAVATPFTTWNTRLASNGVKTLKVTLILADGTSHSDEIEVTVANLVVARSPAVFDPLDNESTQFTVSNQLGIAGTGSLSVEVYLANVSLLSNMGEGVYNGHASGTPVWTTTASFSTGSAQVVWNGKTTGGVPVDAGQYVLHALVSYAGGVQAEYLEPVYTAGSIRENDALSQVRTGVQMPFFDPYYGESVDIGFTLSRPMWITMGFGSGWNDNGMMNSVLYDTGTHVFWWDGRATDQQGLATGDANTPDGLSLGTMVKSLRPPPSMVRLTSALVRIDDAVVDPILIYPASGQVARIDYTLARDAVVTIKVYDTVTSYVGTLFRTLVNAESQAAGAQEIVFDGSDGSAKLAPAGGTFSIEIVAVDAAYPSYTATVRRFIRILQ